MTRADFKKRYGNGTIYYTFENLENGEIFVFTRAQAEEALDRAEKLGFL